MRYEQCTVGEIEVQLVLMKAYHKVRLMKMDRTEIGNCSFKLASLFPGHFSISCIMYAAWQTSGTLSLQYIKGKMYTEYILVFICDITR